MVAVSMTTNSLTSPFFDSEIVIVDLETTGLRAASDRVIEVGAVVVKGNEIVAKFQKLCNPGRKVPSVVAKLTGITTDMLIFAPSTSSVMEEFYDFIGDRPLIAHNAGFDMRFLTQEMARIKRKLSNPSLCTLLLARRLMPEASNHRLVTLKSLIQFAPSPEHRDHRALDDVLVTMCLLHHLQHIVHRTFRTKDFAYYQTVSKMPKATVLKMLQDKALDDQDILTASEEQPMKRCRTM